MVQKKDKQYAALALLEFETVASGILASDLMVKRSPIALLRCGTVHPGGASGPLWLLLVLLYRRRDA